MLPGVLFMALFSARFGALATRFGARWFLVAGPTLMALGVLWLARVPSTSPAWGLRLSATATFAPPVGYLTDLLPGLVLLGLGAMLMVAPLTATLMASVPVEHAGVASAINTAISDVGPQLAIAVLFVVMTTQFYGALARDVPGLDVASTELRRQVAPLDAPGPGVSPQLLGAAREASTGAFRLAMLAGAAFGQTVLAKAAQVCGIDWDSSAAHSARYDAERTADIVGEVCNALDGTWRKAEVRAQSMWSAEPPAQAEEQDAGAR